MIGFSGCNNSDEPLLLSNKSIESSHKATYESKTPVTTPIPKPINIILGCSGDIMCHEMQIKEASFTAKDFEDVEFTFDHWFKYIKPALDYPDLMIGNLETVFAGKDDPDGFTGFPYFNTPDELVPALKNAGFDVLTTANNHSIDRGEIGITRTIKLLDENNIYHTGTFVDQESRNTPLVIDVNGVKVGILSSTSLVQHSRTITKEQLTYMLAISEEEYLVNSIDQLKDAGAQVIVASMHWGYENSFDVDDSQRQLADLLIRHGVDVIFGNHPHVLQPIEKIQVTLDDGAKREALVCWSIGNFIANQFVDNTKRSAIVYAYLSVNPITNEVQIKGCEYLPTYIYNTHTYYFDYHVFPSGTSVKKFNITDFELDEKLETKLEKMHLETLGFMENSYAKPIDEVPKR